MVSNSELTAIHERLGARFAEVNGTPIVNDYGRPGTEYDFLRRGVGLIDLGSRGRLCLAGTDRQRFLHGQVTNEINKLPPGQGCYAAITNAKGKMVADANIYLLTDEILVDVEPGVRSSVIARLEKYIIADDVQIVDVSDQYAMLAVIGPHAPEIVSDDQFNVPSGELQFTSTQNRAGGDIYCMRHSHGAAVGFDLFVPVADVGRTFEGLLARAASRDGGAIGWQALETVRIEAGIPRFRQDMDESNLAPETGIEARAISYSKGCYIGQEVIARIRTYGQVAKALRGLKFDAAVSNLPAHGDKLFIADREVGYVTSAVVSPALGYPIGLGYVRRENNVTGTELTVGRESGPVTARIVDFPFVPN